MEHLLYFPQVEEEAVVDVVIPLYLHPCMSVDAGLCVGAWVRVNVDDDCDFELMWEMILKIQCEFLLPESLKTQMTLLK